MFPWSRALAVNTVHGRMGMKKKKKKKKKVTMTVAMDRTFAGSNVAVGVGCKVPAAPTKNNN